jgi:hypothetical protein
MQLLLMLISAVFLLALSSCGATNLPVSVSTPVPQEAGAPGASATQQVGDQFVDPPVVFATRDQDLTPSYVPGQRAGTVVINGQGSTSDSYLVRLNFVVENGRPHFQWFFDDVAVAPTMAGATNSFSFAAPPGGTTVHRIKVRDSESRDSPEYTVVFTAPTRTHHSGVYRITFSIAGCAVSPE